SSPASPPASASRSTGSTACAKARASKSLLDNRTTHRKRRRRRARKPAGEPLAALHPAPGRDLARDAGDPALGDPRLPPAAALGAARGGLPDDPGPHLLSRREPRGDGLVGHLAA